MQDLSQRNLVLDRPTADFPYLTNPPNEPFVHISFGNDKQFQRNLESDANQDMIFDGGLRKMTLDFGDDVEHGEEDLVDDEESYKY